MFALYMNPMTANCEVSVCVAMAETRERLERFMVDESCEPYTDEGPDLFNFDGGTKSYNKCYSKGSILEMYNPPEGSFCEPCGTIEVPSLDDLHAHHAQWLDEDLSAWNFRFGHALQL